MIPGSFKCFNDHNCIQTLIGLTNKKAFKTVNHILSDLSYMHISETKLMDMFRELDTDLLQLLLLNLQWVVHFKDDSFEK